MNSHVPFYLLTIGSQFREFGNLSGTFLKRCRDNDAVPKGLRISNKYHAECARKILKKAELLLRELIAWTRRQLCGLDEIKDCHSPADRGTKKHVCLPYRGATSFWFYLVPLRLVSTFLNVGRVEISCGLLQTRFSSILL